MNDFPVDIVYTWVDGSDKRWQSKKENILKKYGIYQKSTDVSGQKRFSNNDELKYSLRSVQKYCPWIRNIYIITDNQIPDWINTNNNNLRIIDHKEIFEKNILPTFNSNAIEMRLKYIKGISDNFLSFNDDFFIGKKTTKSDFFYENGLPKIFVGKTKSKLKLKLRFLFPFLKKYKAHASAVSNSRKLIFNKYNKIINYNLLHSVKPLSIKFLNEIEKIFNKEHKTTLKNQFRDNSDTWVVSLSAYYQLARNKNKVKYVQKIEKRDYLNKLFLHMGLKLNYSYVDLSWPLLRVEKYLNLIYKYKPLTFCLNDWPNNHQEADKTIKKFLEKMYPNKSIYEKEI